MTKIDKEDPNASVENEEGQKTAEELVEENTKLQTSLSNVVEEAKGLRKDRTELREKVTELEKAPETPPTENPKENDVEATIRKVLNEENVSKAKVNKKAAFEKFIDNNKEFSSENDPTGMKREALENKLKSFDLSGIINEKDFYSRIKESKILLGNNDTTPKTPENMEINPYSSTPIHTPSPTVVENSEVSDEEKKLYEDKGWTEEKYLKLRDKNPAYFADLLN